MRSVDIQTSSSNPSAWRVVSDKSNRQTLFSLFKEKNNNIRRKKSDETRTPQTSFSSISSCLVFEKWGWTRRNDSELSPQLINFTMKLTLESVFVLTKRLVKLRMATKRMNESRNTQNKGRTMMLISEDFLWDRSFVSQSCQARFK